MKNNKKFVYCLLLVLLIFISFNMISAADTNDTNDLTQSDTSISQVNHTDANILTNENNGNVLADQERTIYVNSTYAGDSEDGSQNAPYKSISNAVDKSSNGDTIYIANGNYNLEDQIIIPENHSLSIIGQEKDKVIITSSLTSSIIDLSEDGSSLSLVNLTFKDIELSGRRVVLLDLEGNESVNVENCVFDNITTSRGVVYLCTSGVGTIDNCTFKNSKCGRSQGTGAIRLEGENTSYIISNSVIDNTSFIVDDDSSFMYGTIYNNEGTCNCTIVNTTISNSNGVADSVVWNRGNMNIIGSIITNNKVEASDLGYHGEAIFVNRGNLTISNSKIYNNEAVNSTFEQVKLAYTSDEDSDADDLILKNNIICNNTYKDSEILNNGTGNVVYENNSDLNTDVFGIITNSTFFNYFDSHGNLLSTVPAGSNLSFYGVFANLTGISSITLTDGINALGVNATLNDIIVQLVGNNISFNNFTIINSKESELDNGIIASGNDINISDNIINVTASGKDIDSFAIDAETINNLTFENNKVYFYGNGTDNGQFRDIAINIQDTNNIKFNNNLVESYLPSCAVGYDANWNANPRSVNIKVSGSKDLVFTNNNVSTIFNNETNGSYDTIYGVYIENTPNATINSNEINTLSNNYGYGLSLLGSYDYNTQNYIYASFNVTSNNIDTESVGYGAWGVQTLLANGTIAGNNISAKALNFTEPVYTEGYLGPSYTTIANNTIYGVGSSGYGISVGGIEENIYNNHINVTGISGIGLNLHGADAVADIQNNTIYANGNSTITGVETAGKTANIQNNHIYTDGNYTVNISGSDNTNVTGNFLVANSLMGDDSVYTNETLNNIIENNNPLPPANYTLTNDTFFEFFDSNGNLLGKIYKGSNLTFNGPFAGLPGITSITLTDGINALGVNATLNDIIVQLIGDNIGFNNFTIINTKEGELDNGIIASGNNINISDNIINVTASGENVDSFAIDAESVNNLSFVNNKVYFYGNGTDNDQFRDIAINVLDSNNIDFDNNLVVSYLPSCAVGYDANWNANPRSVNIKVSNSKDLTFTNNNVSTIYNNETKGSYDTIYGVYIENTPNAKVDNNIINTVSNNYGYGLSLLGGYDYNTYDYVYASFNVTNNNINTESVGYGAWGVQTLLANGTISNNYISAKALNFTEPVYTEGYLGPSYNTIVNNTIYGVGSSGYGIGAGGIEENIYNNNINVTGISGIGLNLNGADAVADIQNNTIYANGNSTITGVDTAGKTANIQNNHIYTNGDYAVNLGKSSNSNVTDNYLVANDLLGDSSVNNENTTNNVYDNIPSYYVNITVVNTNITKYYKNGTNLVVILTNKNGKPLADQNVYVKYDLGNNATEIYQLTTNESGIAELAIDSLPGKYNATVFLKNQGYAYSNMTVPVNITVLTQNVTIEGSNLVKYYKNGSNLRIRLVDLNGVGISNVKVNFTVQGKTYYRTTDSMGYATLTINLYSGKYNVSVAIDDLGYRANKLSVNVTVLKIPATLKIVNTNIKKGTYLKVRLLDKNNKPIKSTQVKITVCGKTYIKTTDANGYAYLKINLNPKKYTVKVSIKDMRNYDVRSTSAKITVRK